MRVAGAVAVLVPPKMRLFQPFEKFPRRDHQGLSFVVEARRYLYSKPGTPSALLSISIKAVF